MYYCIIDHANNYDNNQNSYRCMLAMRIQCVDDSASLYGLICDIVHAMISECHRLQHYHKWLVLSPVP